MRDSLRYWWLFVRALRGTCKCRWRPRWEWESRREWVKDTSCMYHWMKSRYYATNYVWLKRVWRRLHGQA